MYILKVESREEAKELCDGEPLVAGGYATYKLIEFLLQIGKTIIYSNRK